MKREGKKNADKWRIMPAIVCALLSQSAYATSNEEKAAALISDLNELLNAAEQYAVDNGEVLSITSDTDTSYGYLKIDNLITNPNLPHWKGPYVSYKDYWYGGEQYIDHPTYNAAQLLSKEDGEWIRGSSADGCKKSSPSCSIAACIWLVPGDVAQQINFQIDGIYNKEDSDAVGKIRYDNGVFGGLVCMIGGQYPKELSPVK